MNLISLLCDNSQTQNAIKIYVPSDPVHKDFKLGNTIGKKYSHWRRVKHQMPPRYRMFFRFHSNYTLGHDSSPFKCIIFAWLNDETTLRKNGSKSDVYVVFKSLLMKIKIPDDWADLFQ